MSDKLIRTVTESLQRTSIDELLKDDETPFLFIDGSSSMDERMRNGKRRIEGLREAVGNIKSQGHVPMICFGGPYDAQVRFVDNVPEPEGGTPMHLAITLAKEYGATRLVIVSDGDPDLREQTMLDAKAFGGRIDTVFVGDEHDSGRPFLEALAAATGGTFSVGDLKDPLKLSSGIIGLLEGAVEERGPIVGPGFAVVDTPDPADDDEEDDDDEFEEDDDEEADDDDDK